jgi:hypothetical protein
MDVFTFSNDLAEEAIAWFRSTESTRTSGDARKMYNKERTLRAFAEHILSRRDLALPTTEIPDRQPLYLVIDNCGENYYVMASDMAEAYKKFRAWENDPEMEEPQSINPAGFLVDQSFLQPQVYERVKS